MNPTQVQIKPPIEVQTDNGKVTAFSDDGSQSVTFYCTGFRQASALRDAIRLNAREITAQLFLSAEQEPGL